MITYRKFTDEQDYWRQEEFRLFTVKLVNGEQVALWLAERGTRLSNGLWVREIRRRDKQTGHQTAILTTDFRKAPEQVAAAMFARWCQENFFRYMGEHYGLNRLIEYGTEPVPDTTLVSNPALKRKTQEVRRQRAQLLKEKAQFAALTAPVQPEALTQFELEKGQWLERIQQRQQTLKLLKAERKALPKRIPFKDLPEGDRFAQLRTAKKHFVDTIKMIAYRAETALANIAREKLERQDDARSLVRQVLTTTVDLFPDHVNQVLKVRLHPLATAAHNDVLTHLCTELTDSETEYPGTKLRMVFEPIGANEIPRDPEI